MWYIILTIIAVVIYFLKKSKSTFFSQDIETLAEYRHKMIMMLRYKGRIDGNIEILEELV